MAEHLERARLLSDLRRWSQAEREIRRHLAREPEDPDAHRLLAQCLGHQDRLDEALESAKTGLSLAPGDAWSHCVLGDVRWMRYERMEAESAYAEAVRLEPERAGHRCRLSEVRHARHDGVGALAAAEDGLKLDPGSADLHLARGRALWLLERRAEAEASFGDALRLEPEHADAHAELGAALSYRDDRKRALGHLQSALRIEPMHRAALTRMLDLLKLRYPLYGQLLVVLDRRSERAPRRRMLPLLLLLLVWSVVSAAVRRKHGLDFAESLLFTAWAVPLAVYAFMTTVEPFFDLALHVTPEGRHLVPESRIRSAFAVGVTVMLTGVVARVAYQTGSASHLAVLTLLLLMVPGVRFVFLTPKPRSRGLGLLCVVAFALVGFAGAVLLSVPGLGVVGGCVVGITCAAAGLFGLCFLAFYKG